MSNSVKTGIAVLTMLLTGIIVVIVVLLLDGDDTDEAVPAPTPSASPPESPSPSPTGSPAPETPTAEPGTTTAAPPATTTAAPETPTASPETTSEDTPGPPEGEEQTFLGQGLARFESFTVELLPWNPDNAPEEIEGLSGLEVEVCVVQPVGTHPDGTRVSVEPWTLTSSADEVQRPVTQEGYSPAFGPEVFLDVGECTSGWLSFPTFEDQDIDYSLLTYANGLGDRAIWNFH